MSAPLRPVAFVLAGTNHGPMIVNRHDHHQPQPGLGYGVGYQLLERSAFDPAEVDMVLQLLTLRRQRHGDGVFALDGGANVGVHTIEWARHMHGWGQVLAFEAQEPVFYALAGNVALNNCFNAIVRWAALGEQAGQIDVPRPDYLRPGSFGSLELRRTEQTEFIGQAVSYAAADCRTTPMVAIDGLGLQRLDFLKLDVEGMELEVLRGAAATLARCQPIVLVEVIKSGRAAIQQALEPLGYEVRFLGINGLAIHRSDPCREHVSGGE